MTFWQKMFSFEGRMGREDFWICSVILCAIKLVAFAILFATAFGPFIGAAIKAGDGDIPDEEALRLVMGMIAPLSVYVILNLALIWPDLAVKVKRFHDRDQSGWLASMFFANWIFSWLTGIPLFVFWLVDLGILEGTQGPNRYGESPDPQYGPDQAFA